MNNTPFAKFHIEHIRAKQHGGKDNPDNLALACPRCNRLKGPNLSSIDPDTDEVSLLFNPRAHLWDDHFAFVGIEVLGMTPLAVALLNCCR
jgi:hypothetical protein